MIRRMRSSSTLILLGASITSRAQEVPEALPAGDFDPVKFHAVNSNESWWRVASENACTGLQYEYGACKLDSCDQVEHIDCVFDEWSAWSNCDCTGLHSRSRGILTTNNEKGRPCDGNITETERCPAPCHKKVDCKMTAWSNWSPCADRHAQKTKSRTIEVMPSNGGEPCDGVTEKTMPCGDPEPPTNCEFSRWGSWNDCSAPCGGGHRTRHRRIDTPSANNGKLCKGELKELEECNTQACGAPHPCILSNWTEWVGCDDQNPLQKVRRRSVDSPAKDGGEGCADELREIEACVVAEEPPTPCELSGWEPWSECDKTCDGGKQFRSRRLEDDPQNGGTCGPYELRETRACQTQPCHLINGTDCKLSAWGNWSACSAECGVGQRKRTRDVLHKMERGGKGCTDVLVSIEKCVVAECVVVDCAWDDWQEWSGCTCSCDGGTKTRNRQIKAAPLNGGQLCEAHAKTEVGPCGTDPCAPQQCQDAKWGRWLPWGDCSATCGSGFKKRKRLLEEEGNSCGATVEGPREQFDACDAGECSGDEPCEFSEWGKWSDCSCDCYGVAERSRTIKRYSTGKGAACVGSTKQVQPCSPGLLAGFNHTFDEAPADCDKIQPPVDCELARWGDWTECTTTCGGGHKSRDRSVLTPNKNDGAPCDANLTHISTVGCNPEPCDMGCKDCTWDVWSEWSDCSSSGQRHRQRQIDEPANFCGQPCAMKAASSIESCTVTVKLLHCVWSSWTEWSECSEDCGTSEQHQSRNLVKQLHAASESELLFSGDDASMVACFGDQTAVRSCVATDHNGYTAVCPDTCQPIDCEFGKWGNWHKPSCEGLCIRSRVVDQINNGCGKPCNGPLIETKECWDQVECGRPEDCVWTEWNDWTVCQSEFDHKERSRDIDKQPRHNGEACFGSAQQVEPCGTSIPPQQIDCKAADWGPWSRCSATCGGGTQTSTRYLETAAQNGGIPCTEGLKKIRNCAEIKCETPGTDCMLSHWSKWSSCKDGQQTQHRTVEAIPTGSGSTCAEELSRVQACELTETDCVMSTWTGWGQCDKSCGGGQQSRHREVHIPPSEGGKFCEDELRQTQPCNDDPCTVRADCQMSDWTAWESPAVSCGDCQQKKTREVIQTASAGGYGCKLSDMVKTRGCQTSDGEPLGPCPGDVTECVWQEWGAWDACSCPCGGGTHRRTRSILTAPTGAGDGCAAEAKLQVKPCNTQSCEECRDGEWGRWSAWSECSRTCGGGTKKRSRRITQDANYCGNPVEGNTTEIDQCGTDSCQKSIDCEFAKWSEWSSCSCTCFGTQSRSRSIGVQGRADGAFCENSTQDIRTCHPLHDDTPPAGCVVDLHPVDCEFGRWAEWTECSETCGRGQRSHSRQVAVKASDGGRGCDGPMQEVSRCQIEECKVAESKDCVWNDWGDWSACTKCAGQTFRTRSIRSMNEGGGAACEANAGQQTRGCDERKCHEPTFCLWGDWQEWEGCSVTCGDGKRQRARKLVITHDQPEPERLYEKYAQQNAELRRRTDSVENSRVQEMAISFACGALSLVAFFSIARGFRSSGRAATSRAAPLFADEAVE